MTIAQLYGTVTIQEMVQIFFDKAMKRKAGKKLASGPPKTKVRLMAMISLPLSTCILIHILITLYCAIIYNTVTWYGSFTALYCVFFSKCHFLCCRSLLQRRKLRKRFRLKNLLGKPQRRIRQKSRSPGGHSRNNSVIIAQR